MRAIARAALTANHAALAAHPAAADDDAGMVADVQDPQLVYDIACTRSNESADATDDDAEVVTFDELEAVFGDGSVIVDRGDGTFAVDACFVVRTRADFLRLVEADKVE